MRAVRGPACTSQSAGSSRGAGQLSYTVSRGEARSEREGTLRSRKPSPLPPAHTPVQGPWGPGRQSGPWKPPF